MFFWHANSLVISLSGKLALSIDSLFKKKHKMMSVKGTHQKIFGFTSFFLQAIRKTACNQLHYFALFLSSNNLLQTIPII